MPIARPSARRVALALLGCIVALATVAPRARGESFVTFESGQVRPLALSADGTRLYAVNTPDARLEIFSVDTAGLTHLAAVPVGLEPVAVAVRTPTEVWVVNHLSDSVSIVDVGSTPPRVVRTLLVGDEPRDIVFAGAGGGRAFITTAHRGQQRVDPSIAAVPGAGDPQFTTAGVPRADVWVFDAANPGAAFGGTPVRIVSLFGDTPRALAVSPDGSTVFAAIFKSGNRTTVISEAAVCNGFLGAPTCVRQGLTMPGGVPGPSANYLNQPAPEVGLIVRQNPGTGQWNDTIGRDWSPGVRFDLPDLDVFAIDAGTLAQTASWSGVGTTLFNMAVNPVSGAVYVSNTEARNEVHFEGPGVHGGSTVQGHLAEARITVIDGGGVAPRHLNSHIDYGQLPAPVGTKTHSLATPVDMAVTPDGATLYVAAFGSSRIGVVDTAALETGTFDPQVASAGYIDLSGGGPSGVVLDPTRPRLYVLTRFDQFVSVVDLGTKAETQRVSLHNPEPANVVEGRPFLYDAALTSSNGEAACASCHIFGDMDDLAWDLGDPDAAVKKNPIPINLALAVTTGFFPVGSPVNGNNVVDDFHPMKGPMTTQTLRGMDGSGAMHWRGDRANPPGTPGSAFDEVTSFNNFNPAFVGLVGRDAELDPADMQKFTDFTLDVMLPPNPVRPLDNGLTLPQQRGRSFFLGPRLSDGLEGLFFGQPLGFTCEGCHRLNPALKHFGTDGRASFEAEVQIIKIPHLRNVYQKVGMFGVLDVTGVRAFNQPHQGNQIRGFGFLHDGTVDTLFRFFAANVFSNTAGPGGSAVGFQNDGQRRDVEAFMLAFDTNFAPIVGQQITLTDGNAAAVGSRIDLLIARAAAGECDLIAKGVVAGEARGWVRMGDALFQGDRAADAALTATALRGLAATPGQGITFTCMPPGSGVRAGIDRDEDGFLDTDETDFGSDPTDPDSFPGSDPILISTQSLKLRDTSAAKRRVTFRASTRNDPQEGRIVPPPVGTDGDPTVSGGRLIVYNSAGLTDDAVTVALPPFGWSRIGSATSPKGWRFKGSKLFPVQSVVVKADKISVNGGRLAWTYSLDEPAQGRVAMRLTLGSLAGWCADAPAKTRGNPPSTANNDRPTKFTSAKATAPASCPDVPGGGSPSGAFLTDAE